MNVTQAVERACQEPTLAQALSWIAVWETERVVRQVREFDRTGISTASHASDGAQWDTCFLFLFKEVLALYKE